MSNTLSVSQLPAGPGTYRINFSSPHSLKGDKTHSIAIHVLNKRGGFFNTISRFWKQMGTRKIMLKNGQQEQPAYIKLRSIRKRTLLPQSAIDNAMKSSKLENLLTSTIQARQFLENKEIYTKFFVDEAVDRSTLRALFKKTISQASPSSQSANVLIDDTHHLGLSYDRATFTMKAYALRRQNKGLIGQLDSTESTYGIQLKNIDQLAHLHMEESHRTGTRLLEKSSLLEKEKMQHHAILKTTDPSPLIEIPILFKRGDWATRGTLFYFDRTGHTTLQENGTLSPLQYEQLAMAYVTQLAQIHEEGIACGHIDHHSLGIIPSSTDQSSRPYLRHFSKSISFAKERDTHEKRFHQHEDVVALGRALYYSLTGTECDPATIRQNLQSIKPPPTPKLIEMIVQMISTTCDELPNAQELMNKFSL